LFTVKRTFQLARKEYEVSLECYASISAQWGSRSFGAKNNDLLQVFVTTWTSDRIRAEKGAKASSLRDIHTPHAPHWYCTSFFQGAKNCTCTYLSVSQI